MGVLDKMFVAAMFVHVLVCPFTKVEESFNLQAMHDILYHGANISEYDHHEFPGVVPRSFLGPLFISALAYPFFFLCKMLQLNKFASQYAVRMVLGLWTSYCFLRYKRAVGKRFGQGTAKWLLLLATTQFHFLFYASRPLPNTFALGIVLLSVQYWLLQHHARFLWCAGAAVLVFRAEVVLLLGWMVLVELAARRLALGRLVVNVVTAGIVWLALTVVVDSYFWRHLVWPEGEVFWFNTVLNRSSEWGTSPYLWYFYSVLPRALCTSLFLVPLGLYTDKRTLSVVVPAVAFILLYSFLPHKELRFIVYVFPLLNTAAAAACNRIWQTSSKSLLRALMTAAVIGHLVVNFSATCGFLFLSHLNYPGGLAMIQLHNLVARTDVHVHIDVATAQTGVSRFTQIHDHWRYDKTEDLTPGSTEMMQFTHLFIEANEPDSKALAPYKNTHKTLSVIHGFSGLKFRGREFPPIELKTEPMIYLLERKSNT